MSKWPRYASFASRVFSNPNHSHSCQQCHSFKGKGGRVGPELAAKLAGKSPRDIFQKIVVVPHRAADPAYPTMALTTTGGERLVGIRANRDPEQIEFFDTSSLPPTFRTFAKAEVASIENINASAMPDDYASRLSLQQLLDLVAFLKTNVDGVAVAPTLEDVVRRLRGTERGGALPPFRPVATSGARECVPAPVFLPPAVSRSHECDGF